MSSVSLINGHIDPEQEFEKNKIYCKDCKNFEQMKSMSGYFCNEFGGGVSKSDFCSRGTLLDISKNRKNGQALDWGDAE